MPAGHVVKPLRIWLIGFGTVGRWVMRALDSQRERLAVKYGIGMTVVGLASARDGFIYDGAGLDIQSALSLASEGRSIAGQPGVRRWASAIEGLRATEADLLVEVTASPSADGEPGVAHIREALGRQIRWLPPTSGRSRCAEWSLRSWRAAAESRFVPSRP